MNPVETLEYKDWTLSYRLPSGPKPVKIMLLLHGWLGNEQVMWIFGQKAPENCLVLSPRALFSVPEQGFSWTKGTLDGRLPVMADFEEAVEAVADLIHDNPWQQEYDLGAAGIGLMGFSQGAALSYAVAAGLREHIGQIAGLAGFVPDGFRTGIGPARLENLSIWIGHGNRDTVVPVERARAGVDCFGSSGRRCAIAKEQAVTN